MRRDLLAGTVTFLFTDVEGSTRLLHALGPEAYAEALAEHRRVIREACTSEGGVEVDTQGDAFFFAFPTAPGAIAAASSFTDALGSGPIQVRVGLHTGTPLLADEGYVGGDVNRAARIAAAGHGGQVLVSASTAPLVELELVDLGEHRLKDLSAPERIYQLGDGNFPALKSLFRTNLPVPPTPFLGRERELSDVVGLLGSTRLLTLTGPGGTGKTRLAAQAAGLASDGYPDGVWFIPLAPLRDSTLVLEAAAQVVGSKNGLAEHIADKQMLCLFDNFEQVVEAAPDLAALLSDCPNLDVLVTSREPLHVTGEQEYAVPPLAHEEGVGFFLARARAVTPEFAPDDAVSDICARLDDLPLALELAAARVKALSAAQILARLDERLPLLTDGARDLPERQRTLRATIEWSYDLLSEEEQELFARLAVFRGGCTLEAAEEVCEADLDTLHSLVDKSLVRHSHERYWMLETIREYASERLDEAGEAEAVRSHHALFFLGLAEEAEPQLRGNPKEWLDRLEAEHDNLRATFDRLELERDGDAIQRLAGALWRFWSLRGHLAEGRRRLELALQADERPTRARANVLNGATVMALELGDDEAASIYADEALVLHRRCGDVPGTANSTFLLGVVSADREDWADAQRFLEESLELFRGLGDLHYTMLATRNLAWTYWGRGDRASARALHEQNLERARTAGNERMQAMTLSVLASYALEDGRVQDAYPMLTESIAIHDELRDLVALAVDLTRASRALCEERAETSARVLASVEALNEELGTSPAPWLYEYEEAFAGARAQLGEAAFAEAWEKGRKLTVDEAVALALEALADA